MNVSTSPGPDLSETLGTAERTARILLSEAELAEALGTCQRTVARLRHGGLPHVALPVPGRTRPLVRYRLADVQTWLAAHTRGEIPKPAPEPPTPVRRRAGRPRRPAEVGA